MLNNFCFFTKYRPYFYRCYKNGIKEAGKMQDKFSMMRKGAKIYDE